LGRRNPTGFVLEETGARRRKAAHGEKGKRVARRDSQPFWKEGS